MGRRWRELFASSVVYTAAAILPVTADAAPICPAGRAALAQLVSVQGTVEVNAASAQLGTLIHLNDILRVGPQSRAAIVLCDTDTVLRIDQNTVLRFEAPRRDRSLLRLIRGAVYFFTQEPQTLDFETPFVNAGVKGTEFVLRVDADDKATVVVIEGVVQLTPVPSAETTFEQPGQSLTSGQSAEAVARRVEDGTRRVVVRDSVVDERQAVQWAVYYQPVLTAAAAAQAPEAIRRASELLRGGRLAEARVLLESYTESGEAHALLAVIAVARSDTTQALVHATRAVELDPDSASARIALSYALQANFRLEAARDAAQTAVALEPRNALAWARLAELQMSLGLLSRALGSAREAERLSPELARTQIVLGFAALARFRIADAADAFEAAVALDSQDPLARLGLGLARIRRSDLSEGRRELEIAVALDPANALLRSYLGKAYFEERRAGAAATQFELAKPRDPNDPTPWLYDALLKQSENRPVEALSDIRESIDKNDNRAVYRSRLLLDEDLAARGASLGRIYDDLGFGQIAITEATKSLSIDPTNHSAHRFLSDSYALLPRHEIARASELLQAQLYQPINISPVQPQLTEIDLNIPVSVGPANVGFNEFTPLFQRNGQQFIGAVLAGNNDTFGDELALSGIEGPLSFSAGQFHFESDGFRPNNDVQHDIFNAFTQLALTSNVDVQFAYRRRDSDQGDLRLNFDPDDFSPFDRRRITQETPRAGLHLSPSPRSDFVLSFIHTDRREELDRVFPGGAVLDARSDMDANDLQAQYTLKTDRLKLTAGGGGADIDIDRAQVLDISGTFPGGICPPFPPFFGVCTIPLDADESNQQRNAYLYANANWPAPLIWTFGVSYDDIDGEFRDIDRTNPKVGLQWNVTERLHLRAAYFKTLKRDLVANQTLEPTQVAGFNQLFDDFNGTKTERYGVALDANPYRDFFAGVELSERDLDVAITELDEGRVTFEEQDEKLYRAYTYWAPHPQWAFTAEYSFEQFEREGTEDEDLPTQVDTSTVPVALRYFKGTGRAPGLFGEIRVTYVNQDVELPPGATFEDGDEDFVVTDVAIGYRLGGRRGLLSFQVGNLLDEEFRFQDVNIQSSVAASTPRFIPERSILATVTLNF